LSYIVCAPVKQAELGEGFILVIEEKINIDSLKREGFPRRIEHNGHKRVTIASDENEVREFAKFLRFFAEKKGVEGENYSYRASAGFTFRATIDERGLTLLFRDAKSSPIQNVGAIYAALSDEISKAVQSRLQGGNIPLSGNIPLGGR
jgi:hypothetical protein